MEAATGLGVVVWLVLALLGLFISIVWIIFPFIVMGRMNLLQKEMEKTQAELQRANTIAAQMLAEAAKSNKYLWQIATAGKNSAPAPVGMANPPIPVPSRTHPKSDVLLNVSKDGQSIGFYDLRAIKEMLKNGDITPEDFYFDEAGNDWYPLNTFPAFS